MVVNAEIPSCSRSWEKQLLNTQLWIKAQGTQLKRVIKNLGEGRWEGRMWHTILWAWCGVGIMKSQKWQLSILGLHSAGPDNIKSQIEESLLLSGELLAVVGCGRRKSHWLWWYNHRFNPQAHWTALYSNTYQYYWLNSVSHKENQNKMTRKQEGDVRGD